MEPMEPNGIRRLRRQLTDLGLDTGQTVLVHSSLRRVGPIPGGAEALRDLLLEILDPARGTLVVPAQTGSASVSSREFLAATAGASAAQYAAYLDRLPGFDPDRSPSEGMGALAEAVRTHPEARRSAHPITSFAAVGRLAGELMGLHPLDSLLGKESPLGRMYEYGALVLLLGVGYDKCTAFHLGENPELAPERGYRCKIGETWRDFRGPAHRDAEFAELGTMFESARAGRVRTGPVGAAAGRLFALTEAADFAATTLPSLRFAR
jgi:aminoglycoside 3-N-acetyltransferase